MPTVSALILGLMLEGEDEAAVRNARWFGLVASLATLLLALFIPSELQRASASLVFEEVRTLPLGIDYHVAADPLSTVFVLLVAGAFPIAMLTTWTVGRDVKGIVVTLLLMEAAALGALLAQDLVLWAVAVELPLVLLIAARLSGVLEVSQRAMRWCMLALIVGLFSTIFFVAGVLSLGFGADRSAIWAVAESATVVTGVAAVLGGALSLSIAAKLAIFPLHAWFLGVSKSAPIPLTLGLVIAMVSIGVHCVATLILPLGELVILSWLAIASAAYASLRALQCHHIKQLPAWGVLIALATVVSALLHAHGPSGAGAVLLSIALVLTFGGLAYLLAIAEARTGHTLSEEFGGLIYVAPAWAAVTLIFIFMFAGLPLSGVFAGLSLSFLGLAIAAPVTAVLLAAALAAWLFGAVLMFQRMVKGPSARPAFKELRDLGRLWVSWPRMLRCW
ncbi:MAG: proton-conducting transporter membrane subunit [Pseudomonadota bacterium]